MDTSRQAAEILAAEMMIANALGVLTGLHNGHPVPSRSKETITFSHSRYVRLPWEIPGSRAPANGRAGDLAPSRLRQGWPFWRSLAYWQKCEMRHPTRMPSCPRTPLST